MCGIAGLITKEKVEYELIKEMIQSIKHRGPDDTGIYIEDNVGLAHSRLSIMDPRNGRQPITNEDDSIVIIFNGEIYNYLVLRKDLEEKGHLFKNNSDTAILPHMYEEYGSGMFEKLNGQFAIAIWDRLKHRLLLGRDRLGEKPLYYYHNNETFSFASEAKAIFKSGVVDAVVSPISLKQVFTYWTTLSNRSIFEDIYQIPPGCCLVYENCHTYIEAYWKINYSKSRNTGNKNTPDYINELEDKLIKSIKGRMMADVPISFYLSGGLDSSLIAGIAARISNQNLNTFSITFDDNNFDESIYQNYMSKHLETNHQKVMFSKSQIPSIIKEVIYHTEVPLLRSGAFPMYVLAKLVESNDIKVALSGEGSDELFGGYDIFREVKIREFCSRNPESKYRSALYKRVNNFVQELNKQPASSLSLYYNNPNAQSWFSSHYSRWRLGTYSQQFFSSDYSEIMKDNDELKQIEELLPKDFMTWTPLQQAQYLEVETLFSNYLLSSQGDRVSMAASIECRYPFLDYDLVEFANSIPDNKKIMGLNEKYIVKKLAKKYVPEMIVKRKKFPYRAPINISELMKDEYVRHMINSERLRQYGIFNPSSVEKFLSAAALKQIPNERDCMLLMGILTTQILYDEFVGKN
jgi:asparagine synthase (glutamine-hydrolysing)